MAVFTFPWPARLGAGGGSAERAARPQRLLWWGAFFMIVGVTLGQRIGWVLSQGTGSQEQQIPLCMLTTYLGLCLFLLAGRLTIDMTRLMLCGLTFGVIILTLFVAPKPFSIFSLLYLLTLYLPFVLSLPASEQEYRSVLRIFQNCLIPVAIIGILQFVMNAGGQEFPPFMDWLPERFVLAGYNTHPITEYASTQIRANGELFLEPSFLSQFMAYGVLIELIWLKRPWRMALYGAALVASLSGTGLILLGGFGVITLIKRQKYLVLGALVLVALMVVTFFHNSLFDSLLGRVTEYQTSDSSAFMRFVGPFRAIGASLGNEFPQWIAGLGPGTAKELQVLGIPFSPFPAAKLMIEYGVMGTVVFIPFITYCFFVRAFSGIFAAATYFSYMLLSASLQQPHTVFLCFALTVLFRNLPQEAAQVNEAPSYPDGTYRPVRMA